MKNTSPQIYKVCSNKNQKKYFMIDSVNKVYFSGDFDSGNMERVQQISSYEYRIYAGLDHPTQQCTTKTFFHFRVSGFASCRVRFRVARLNILNCLLKEGASQVYRPVFKQQDSQQYERLNEPVKIMVNSYDQTEMIFEYAFEGLTSVYFAFSFPYSYTKNLYFIEEMHKLYQNDPEIYFHREVLTHSFENRKVHLLTITDRANIEPQKQPLIQGLFPQVDNNSQRPFKIKSKPRILITARVHPGETTASYCFEGLVKFLLNRFDYRSYLLRKHFHFQMVPMLNPDGVFHGFYRLDLSLNNLNRFYGGLCNRKLHPTIWAVKALTEHFNNVDFYLDLHGHASRKPFFVYGNAFDDIHLQAQAEIFAKIIQYNCQYFGYQSSNFTRKHMKSKDPNEALSKEGCGRVFMFKTFNTIHSYTLELGFHFQANSHNNFPLKNTNRRYLHYEYSDQFEPIQTTTKYSGARFFTPDCYMNLGKNVLVSILDLFQKNPYTRIDQISILRKYLSTLINQHNERFKQLDPNCNKKIKNINELIIEEYYQPRFGKHTIWTEKILFDKIEKQISQRVTFQRRDDQNKTMRSSLTSFKVHKMSTNTIQLELIHPPVKSASFKQSPIIKNENNNNNNNKLDLIIEKKNSSLKILKNMKNSQRQITLTPRLDTLKHFLYTEQKIDLSRLIKRHSELPKISRKNSQDGSLQKLTLK